MSGRRIAAATPCALALCRFCEKGSLERAVRLGKFKRKTEEQAELVGAGETVTGPGVVGYCSLAVGCQLMYYMPCANSNRATKTAQRVTTRHGAKAG
jgi:hypothetical protein